MNKGTEMKFKNGLESVDCDARDIDGAMSAINDIISACVANAINHALSSGGANARLPYSYIDSDGAGMDRPADPLTVYIDIPFDDCMSEEATFEFSLSESVMDCVGLHKVWPSGKVEDEEAKSMLREMSSALRELADKLDDSLGG